MATKLQTANVMLALGGDGGNTVPKFGVTAAEIAVLRSIHGEDAVTDIEPSGEVERSHREERSRLLGTYGKFMDGKDVSPVSDLFPGAAARVFETFDELGLQDEFFKAETRVRAAPTVEAKEHDEADDEAEAKPAKAAKPAKKGRAKKHADPAPAPAPVPEDDGVEDMTDAKVFE